MAETDSRTAGGGSETRKWFWLALALLFAWLVWKLAPVITPFVISAALAYLFDPLTDRLERVRIGSWRWNRTFAVVLVFFLMISLLVLLILVIVPLIQTQVEQLVARAPAFLDWLGGTAWPWIQQTLGLQGVSLDAATITENLKSYWREASAALVAVLGKISRSGQAVLSFLINLVLVPVVTFYLLRDWDKLIAGIRMMIPRRYEPLVSGLARDIDNVLGAFIRGQLIVMLALGLIYAFGLWAIGLDLAVIIGLGAGLLSIVPYLGTFVGVGAGLIAAMFQFQDLTHLLMVAAVFVIGQMLEGMVLTPKLVGDRIGLHPVAVIFAVLAGGQLAGFLGILLALPVAAALNVLVRHIHDEYRKSSYYGDEASPVAESEVAAPQKEST
jgi:predicted PurR-regulated permease PerM